MIEGHTPVEYVAITNFIAGDIIFLEKSEMGHYPISYHLLSLTDPIHTHTYPPEVLLMEMLTRFESEVMVNSIDGGIITIHNYEYYHT